MKEMPPTRRISSNVSNWTGTYRSICIILMRFGWAHLGGSKIRVHTLIRAIILIRYRNGLLILYWQENKSKNQRVSYSSQAPIDEHLCQQWNLLRINLPSHSCSCALHTFVETTVSTQSLWIICQTSNVPIAKGLKHSIHQSIAEV